MGSKEDFSAAEFPDTDQVENSREGGTEFTPPGGRENKPERPETEGAAENDPESAQDAGRPGADCRDDTPPRSNRRRILTGAAALAAAAVLGTVLTVGLSDEPQPEPVPHTVAVTYAVTGDGPATIAYNGGRPDAPRKRKQSVELPWTEKLRVNPESGAARVSIILGEEGGRAQCALAVDGRHRQRATAFGAFGRATCSAKVPRKDLSSG